jgi:hypothetical protein
VTRCGTEQDVQNIRPKRIYVYVVLLLERMFLTLKIRIKDGIYLGLSQVVWQIDKWQRLQAKHIDNVCQDQQGKYQPGEPSVEFFAGIFHAVVHYHFNDLRDFEIIVQRSRLIPPGPAALLAAYK